MSVASKNPFGLLSEDGEAPVVVKGGDKNARGAKTETSARGGNTGRRGYSGNEAAFRDRNAGSDRNRNKGTDDGTRGPARGGYGARVRGGRGSRYPRDRDDRHTKNIAPGSEKQAAQSWGAAEGEAELKDEVAGEEIAKTEAKAEGEGEAKEAVEPEPEDKHISYEDYLAQLAQKKLALEGPSQVRQANEGSKLDKKWANAKPLVKDEDDEFISASGAGKSKRERERKVKQVVEIDNRYVEPERTRGGRGGRGGSRGGAPRGAPRGGGRGRGDGPRGENGRGRGGKDVTINTNDQQAFPSLGK